MATEWVYSDKQHAPEVVARRTRVPSKSGLLLATATRLLHVQTLFNRTMADRMQDVAQALKEWLIATYGLDREGLSPDTPLFSTGLLDSFNLIELVTQFEKLAGRRVRPLDLNLDNFDSLAKIAAYATQGAA